jgi:amino acid permease
VELKEVAPTDTPQDLVPLQQESEVDVGLLSDVKPPQSAGTSSIAQTAFNFVNTIIGSGIIGLPFAMNEAGLPLGIIELVLFAIMTDYSVNILVESGVHAGQHSYQGVCRSAFGVACLFVSPH